MSNNTLVKIYFAKQIDHRTVFCNRSSAFDFHLFLSNLQFPSVNITKKSLIKVEALIELH